MNYVYYMQGLGFEPQSQKKKKKEREVQILNLFNTTIFNSTTQTIDLDFWR